MAKTPRLSILEYVTLDLPFDEELAAFKAGGAEGIGISEFTGPPIRELSTMQKSLKNGGLELVECWPSVPSFLPLPGFGGPQEPKERTKAMCDAVRRLATLNPIGCGCITGGPGVYTKEQAYELVAEGLAEVDRVAGELGIKIAIEPIHHSIAANLTLVTTIQQTVDLIEHAGAKNVGLSFDIWHSWDQPNLFEEIREHVDRFVLVHVCDWREPTRSWCDRLLPGEGVGNAAEILGVIDAAGYDGWYELEVLSDNGVYGNNFPEALWNLSPTQLMRRGKEAFMKTWNERRVPADSKV